MEIGKWKMAQAWRHFKRPASSKGMWKQFVDDSKEQAFMGTITPEFDELSPREEQYYQKPPFSTNEVFLGSKGGQPGPGRPGYDRGGQLKGTYVNQKGYEANVKKMYDQNADYDAIKKLKKKFKNNKNISGHDLDYGMNHQLRDNFKQNYETSLQQEKNKRWLKKNNYIAVDQLADDIDVSKNALLKNRDNWLKKYKPLKNIGTGEYGPNTVWIKKPTKEQSFAIQEFHPGTGGAQGGFKQFTVDAMKELHGDEKFLKFIKDFKPDDDISASTIRKMFSMNAAYSPYVLNAYASVLDGTEKIKGIKVNKALAQKIKDNIYYSSSGEMGAWHRAARKIAVKELDRVFNPDKVKGKNFQNRIDDVRSVLDKYGLGKLNVDEIQALKTGYRGGTGPYSIFSQILTKQMNQKLKGSQFDAQTSKRQVKLNKAIKAENWDLVDDIIKEQDDYVEYFRKTHPQFENVNLTKFDLRKPKDVMGDRRWYSLPEEARKALRENWRKQQYSLNLGKNLTTQVELKTKLGKTSSRNRILQDIGFPIKKCLNLAKGGSPDQCIKGVINETIEKAKGTGSEAKAAQKILKKSTGVATKLGYLIGWADAPLEISFAAPHLLMGDVEAAKRATTFGLTGWGKVDLDNVDNPEARKYLKHRRDTEDWINNWEKHYYYSEKLKNLPDNASDALRNTIEAEVNKRASNMDSIAQNYEGYDRSGSENENWAYNPEELAGKKAAKNWIDTKVETDLDKQLAKTHGLHGDPFLLDLASPYADVEKEKLRASPTDLESFIKTKGEDFHGDPEGWWFYRPLKQEEAEAHGVGNIYDDYYMGASEGKDIRDSYSSIPLDYASQLGALEAKETREGLKRARYNPLSEMYYNKGGRVSYLDGGIVSLLKK